MKEIGQQLRERRESLKISLEDVSIATKINIKILQAVEDGDLSRLPAKPFIRGFVQSYAKYLGLDVNEVLRQFNEALGTAKPVSSMVLPETNDVEKNLPGSGRNILAVAAIVLAIIVILVIQKVISDRERAIETSDTAAITGSNSPILIESSPADMGLGESSPTPVQAVMLESPTPAVAVLKPSVAPSLTPTPSPSATPKPSPSPSPSPKPSPSPSPKPTATPTPVAKPSATPVKASSPTATAAEATGQVSQTLVVEALDSVTLKVSIDGGAPQDVTMTADQVLTFKARRKLSVTSQNGGAISIIHNGKELGVPGNLGQPKTVVFGQ
ncbi:MAG: helix-turn-helix domain-containing protein [Oligoflexia bacterium]|nr:helix-turn-helix domain-containing protein [Oligoflexia bacterium]